MYIGIPVQTKRMQFYQILKRSSPFFIDTFSSLYMLAVTCVLQNEQESGADGGP